MPEIDLGKVKGDKGDFGGVAPKIIVFATSGSTVTCTDGTDTMTKLSTGDSVYFELPRYGTWRVQATLDDVDSDPRMVYVDVCKIYAVHLSGANVYGAVWDYGNSNTQLRRLTPETDPNGYVTVAIDGEPSPAVGDGEGSSPFDTLAPWRDMEEYNIVDGAVGAKQGQDGFSRTDNDTVVYIPNFYFKSIDDPAKMLRYFYIADAPRAGFDLHPGSGRYVGKYAAAVETVDEEEVYVSKSGLPQKVSITRGTARAGATAKGEKWCLYDFATYCAVVSLYIVEYADWNSQEAVAPGISEGVKSAASDTGLTDTMTYHTGREAGEDIYACQMQYRHIEGLWGDTNKFVDGAVFSNREGYICLDPNKYADAVTEDYTDTGIALPPSNFITGLGFSEEFPWAIIPNAASGGSSTTFIPDRCYSNASGVRILNVGGNYPNPGGSGGLLCFNGYNTATIAGGNLGARLLYIP